jgi:oligoribonuclease
MIDFVRDMHRTSGLTDDLLREQLGAVRHMIDYKSIEFLDYCGIDAGTAPLCGNSIGSLDRPFVIQHFPKLNKFLHYRNIDMSSDKELLRMHRPDLYEELKPIIGTKENATHRALDDARASIAEYKVYLEHWWKI